MPNMELVNNMYDYLSNAISYIPSLIDRYRHNNYDDIVKDMTNLCEGLIWIEQNIKYVLEDSKISFANYYNDIFDSLQNEDYHLTADILCYDIVDTMKELIKSIEDRYDA